MENTKLWQLYRSACQRLLNEQDRNRHSLTFGCFDRRHWGWKLVDYAESTFQRGVYPLAWWLKHDDALSSDARQVLADSVIAGLLFSTRIQHKDGSFDQAFPHEHSFGATAFLLHPSIYAYRVIKGKLSCSQAQQVEAMLKRASTFLCGHKETHGLISNHLAGAVLSLYEAAELFSEPKYAAEANAMLAQILNHQSAEGWFMEYDGADPGYQTLCMYYLAQVHRIDPSDERLLLALKRSAEFLSFFIHPDGTFGGEYGSRRTAVYYPGGLSLLSNEIDVARSMACFMQDSILNGRTLNPTHVDIGNLAPLLSNYALLLESGIHNGDVLRKLPCQTTDIIQDFPQAGLHVRSTAHYYAVFGSSNGGVLKVFGMPHKNLLWNDAGYIGELTNGTFVTTQMTETNRVCEISAQEISVQVPFYDIPRSLPGPFQFILLRILNVTIMRNIFLGNVVKSLLVNLLIRSRSRVPLSLTRKIYFRKGQVEIRDEIRMSRPMMLKRLEYAHPFVSIHMASAGYFENFETASSLRHGIEVPVDELMSKGVLERRAVV
jgi:hypothetical protein